MLEFANKRNRKKVLFAGYYTWVTYERTFSEMNDLPLDEETWPAFLGQNAIEIYGLHDFLDE